MTDTWNFGRFLPALFAALFLAAWPVGLCLEIFGAAWKSDSFHLKFTAILFFILVAAIFLVLPCLLITAKIATTQIGLLIYKKRGYFVIPADWSQNTFTENILRLQIIHYIYEMERIKINQLKKITREGGKTLFIHGDFGTRKLTWRDKQKRDECVAALENAYGRRLGSYF